MPRPSSEPAERVPPSIRRPRVLLTVALFAAFVRIGFALLVTHPSYTDSYYYAAVAKSLAHGGGFTIDSIWNFIDVGGAIPGPGEGILPIPSNRHWMPFASILQWPFLVLFGDGFRTAQIPFLLFGIVVPVLAAYVGLDVFGSRRVALGAGILATFSGSLSASWVVIETFVPFGVFGGLVLISCYKGLRGERRPFVLGGLWAGLGALTRIDGIFLLLPIGLTFLLSRWSARRGPAGRPAPISVSSAVLAGALFMAALGPWLIRDLVVFGAPFPSAGRSTLLMRTYNDLYSVSSDLSLDAYLRWGLWNIIRSKIVCFGLITMNLAVVLSLVLLPLVLVAAWAERRRRELWPFFAYASFLYLSMGLVFTAHAPRGFFFHSVTAWVPFLFPLAVVGFDRAVEWEAGRRGRDVEEAKRNLGRVGLAGLVVSGAVWGVATIRWIFDENSVERLRPVAEFLEKNSRPDDVILCVDPPTYTAITGRRCVITPYDDLETLRAVAAAYRPAYVAFDRKMRVPSGVEVVARGKVPVWLSPEPVFKAGSVWIYAVDRVSIDGKEKGGSAEHSPLVHQDPPAPGTG